MRIKQQGNLIFVQWKQKKDTDYNKYLYSFLRQNYRAKIGKTEHRADESNIVYEYDYNKTKTYWIVKGAITSPKYPTIYLREFFRVYEKTHKS